MCVKKKNKKKFRKVSIYVARDLHYLPWLIKLEL